MTEDIQRIEFLVSKLSEDPTAIVHGPRFEALVKVSCNIMSDLLSGLEHELIKDDEEDRIPFMFPEEE